MRITEVELTNVRCFKYLKINLDRPKDANQWALIIGNNSEGKSTVLRSIAMGLCDATGAGSLLSELRGRFIRYGARTATIRITLSDGRKKYWRETIITGEDEKVFQSSSSRLPTKAMRDLFVVGYGTGRVDEGTADYNEYFAVDAVYTLFKYSQQLQNPELGFRRVIDEARKRNPKNEIKAEAHVKNMIFAMLRKLLNLKGEEEIELTKSGIFLRKNRALHPIGSLGDGYRSTLTWVMDLISWWLLSSLSKRKRSLETTDINGILILDEIEQHLHPRWQKEIISLLWEVFPRIQLIGATHSPLVLSGSLGCSIFALSNGKLQERNNVYGWRAEDVYTDVMDMQSSRPDSFERDVEILSELELKKLRKSVNAQELKKLKSMRESLKGRLSATDPLLVTIRLDSMLSELKSNRNKK